MREIWKNIYGFEDLYGISNTGNVLSYRKRACLSLRGSSHQYARVHLCRDGNRTEAYVHDLVAEAFIGQKPNGHEVNHKDMNKRNNVWSNLEYATRSENIVHAIVNGARGYGMFERRILRSDGKMFKSIVSAALEVGKTPAAISRVLSGKMSTCAGFGFSYAEPTIASWRKR